MWKIVKCGVGEGWRRSAGPIVSEMKFYIESGTEKRYIQ
jgi:hypothetical protein